MSEVEDLGMNREYRSLVGAYRGARILAMSTGMGGVSTGIAVEELHNIGVTHAIRIGSCGALQTDIAPGELLIAAGAVRERVWENRPAAGFFETLKTAEA